MKLDFEKTASTCAIIVAVIALFTAVYEAKVTREHQEVSVWPSLSIISTSVHTINGRTFNFAMNLVNNGLGPAKIKNFDIKYNGVSHKNLGAVIGKFHPNLKNSTYSTDKGALKVLLPGKIINLVSTDLTQKQQLKWRKENIEISICYCSLYNTCWKLENNNDSTPVNSCTDII